MLATVTDIAKELNVMYNKTGYYNHTLDRQEVLGYK